MSSAAREPDSGAAAPAPEQVRRLLDDVAAVDQDVAWTPDAWQAPVPGRGTAVVASEVRAGGDGLAGYGEARRDGRAWNVATAVDPTRRRRQDPTAGRLLATLISRIALTGAGPVTWWVSRAAPYHYAAARGAGLNPDRSLYQMRRSLPVEPERSGPATPLATSPFRPGIDEDAWLRVNNRAFAWHPEQGGWDVADVEAREAEDWFDPKGFLLHRGPHRGLDRSPHRGLDLDAPRADDPDPLGAIDGFCWTKVHPATPTEAALGEIYVIATDPDAAGAGLGRALVLAGLDHLWRAGIGVGILYVDAGNTRAVKLYVDLGFVVDHVDTAFTGTVAPRGA